MANFIKYSNAHVKIKNRIKRLKTKITIKSKLTVIKTTMIKMHDGKGEFLAWR